MGLQGEAGLERQHRPLQGTPHRQGVRETRWDRLRRGFHPGGPDQVSVNPPRSSGASKMGSPPNGRQERVPQR
jgi:hypothetical protein